MIFPPLSMAKPFSMQPSKARFATFLSENKAESVRMSALHSFDFRNNRTSFSAAVTVNVILQKISYLPLLSIFFLTSSLPIFLQACSKTLGYPLDQFERKKIVYALICRIFCSYTICIRLAQRVFCSCTDFFLKKRKASLHFFKNSNI